MFFMVSSSLTKFSILLTVLNIYSILFYTPYQILLFSKVLWIHFYCLLFLLVSIYIVMSSSMSVFPPPDCVPNVVFVLFRNNLKSRMVLSFSTQKIILACPGTDED